MSHSRIDPQSPRPATPGLSRRALLHGAALAGGLGLLAACGNDGADSGSGGSSADAGTSGSKPDASSSAPGRANAGSGSSASGGSSGGAEGLNAIFGPGGEEGGAGVQLPAGMLLAMTGAGSFFGKVMSAGAKLAAKQIKDAGGIDYQISIADHKDGSVQEALNGTRQMITQDGIKILQTSYGAPSEAIVPLIGQYKVLSFNGGGSSPGQVGKPFLWQTRMLFGDDPAPGGLAWIAREFPDAKKLAIIGTQENGVAGAKEIGPKMWTELTGGEVVANEQHDVGATDFSAIVARVRSTSPDAILTFSFGDDVGYLVKQLREANVTVPIMGIEFTEQAATIAGDTYDTYNFATDFYDVNNPNPWNKIFVEDYRAEYGEDPEYYGANYYEQVFFVWELVRRVIADGGDPTDAAALQASLEANPKFLSLYGGTETEPGEVEFNPEDHLIAKPMAVFKVAGGDPEKVADIQKIGLDDDPASALL